MDERKTKLLKDYNVNKKSNAFLDKRFGENDPELSLEEKMFMRFQFRFGEHGRTDSQRTTFRFIN